jgi:hypothetical protein
MRYIGVKDNMKKNINKKVVIISAIVMVVAIIGIIYIVNKPSKLEASTSTAITATVGKATFGSAVNVILSDAGKKQYKDVVKYEVYFEGKPITAKSAIGTATTAFPVRKVNDKVSVKLLKSNDKIAYSVDLKLTKGAEVKINQ